MNRDDASAREVTDALRELDEVADGFVLVLASGPRGGEAAIESMSARWRGDRPMTRHDLASQGADLGAAAHRVGDRGFLLVTGLEQLDVLDRLLALREANLGRDRLLGSTARVIWWVDEASVALIRDTCPDLWSWIDLRVRVARLGSRPQPELVPSESPRLDRLLAALTSDFHTHAVATPTTDRIAAAFARGDVTVASPAGIDAARAVFRAFQDAGLTSSGHVWFDGRNQGITDIAAWKVASRGRLGAAAHPQRVAYLVDAAHCFPTMSAEVDVVITPIRVVDDAGAPDLDELSRLRDVANGYGRWDLVLSPAELRDLALASSGLDEPFVQMLRDTVLRRIDVPSTPITEVIATYRQRLVERLTPDIARAIVGFVQPASADVDDPLAREAVARGLLLPWTETPLTWRVHRLLDEDVRRQAAPLISSAG